MFTDTKNLAQNTVANFSECQNSSSSSSSCTMQKSKGKFHHKVLKPLLRLVKLKSTKSPNAATITHPNNINLNNTNNHKDISELPATFLEDYAAAIRKVTTTTIAVKEQESRAPQDITTTLPTSSSSSSAVVVVDDSTAADTAVISSASIEKSSAVTTCHGCSHGRNCQHEHSHYDYDKINHTGLVVELPAIENLSDVPVHFIRTDNGTFFWTNAQEKIDDDLLQEWLCHSFLQFPTEAVFY